jgi:hypothetical protein
MKKDDSSQKINCDVDSCKFNDNDCRICNLDQIKVAANDKSCDCKDETICDSFKCKKESSK